MDDKRLAYVLVQHEGWERFPYTDTVGKLTIGAGRNLSDVGLSDDEISLLLKNDINNAKEVVRENVRGFSKLNSARQEVVVNMVFNMGWGRFRTFRKFLNALYVQDFDRASAEMLDSKWASQVPRRAMELANVMRLGVWYHRGV